VGMWGAGTLMGYQVSGVPGNKGDSDGSKEMTRQIICMECAADYTPGSYPGEWWHREQGKARGFGNRDFVCDFCNVTIPKGTECVAQSLGLDQDPYRLGWETEYLGEPSDYATPPGPERQSELHANRGNVRDRNRGEKAGPEAAGTAAMMKDADLWRVSSDGLNVYITKSPLGILRGSDEIANFTNPARTTAESERLAEFVVRAAQALAFVGEMYEQR